MRRSTLPVKAACQSIADCETAHLHDSGSTATGTLDWSFRVLVMALFAAAVWLLAMPFVPAIARCTMQRFHLRTASFPLWAIQQPIPPMYSFANTTQVRSLPPGGAIQNRRNLSGTSYQQSLLGEVPHGGLIAGRVINHFPTREFTFANARVRYLRDRSSKWFVLSSTYRGQSVKSVYRLDPAPDGGWTATLLTDNETEDEDKS